MASAPSPNKNSKKNNEISFKNTPFNQKLSNIPNDQYNCTECNLVPEILDIDYSEGTIIFECPNHGQKTVQIEDYFKNESKYLYTNHKCDGLSNHSIGKNNLNEILNYCLKCQKYYCLICSKQHDKGHQKSILKSNEINNKCHIHFENYKKYCRICNKHFCNEDKMNCNHEINDIKNADDKDIEQIKNKIAQIKKNIENENYYIKLLNTILISHEKHPSNYFYNTNISNIVKNINNFKYIDKKLLIEKINNLEEKLLDLNSGFEMALTGNELKIYLNGKNLQTIELNFLNKLDFDSLEELNLSHNNIANIEAIKNFKKIKKIDLSNNRIENIKPLIQLNKKINLSINNSKINKELEEIYNLLNKSNDKNNKISIFNQNNNINYEKEIEKYKKINQKLKNEIENLKKKYEENIVLLTSQIDEANKLISNLKNKINFKEKENSIQNNSDNNSNNMNNNNNIDNNTSQNPIIFPSITNMRMINNQIFFALNMNQINPINNSNQNELIINFRSSSGIEIKINANPNMSVQQLLNLFFTKTNLKDDPEKQKEIHFLYRANYLGFNDNNNILRANLFNGSVITVIDVNSFIQPIN